MLGNRFEAKRFKLFENRSGKSRHHGPWNSQTKCRSDCLNASLRLGITIRKNRSTLSFSSNPAKKVSSK